MDLEKICELQRDPRAAAISQKQLAALRSFLDDGYGIKPGVDTDLELCKLADDGDFYATVMRLEEIQENRVSKSRAHRERGDQDFYELIAMQPFLGIMHSYKWSFIFDVAAYMQALCELLAVRGLIADIGCHVGYHSTWLAESSAASVVGLDRCSAAIHFAESTRFAREVPHGKLEFRCQKDLKGIPAGTVDIVMSSDGGVDWTTKCLRTVVPLLHEDGVVAWFGDMPDRDQIIPAAERAGLHLLHADVIGGWTGQRYEPRTVLLAGKRPVGQSIKDPKSFAERIWGDGFRKFCNSGENPRDKQTLAHYRSIKSEIDRSRASIEP
jgi:hypothetical protein